MKHSTIHTEITLLPTMATWHSARRRNESFTSLHITSHSQSYSAQTCPDSVGTRGGCVD